MIKSKKKDVIRMDICLKGSENEEKILFRIVEIGDYDVDDGFAIKCELRVDTRWCRIEGIEHYTYLYHFLWFRDRLRECYDTLQGEAGYDNFYEGDDDCELIIKMTSRGHALIIGKISENAYQDNTFLFTMETDQSCFPEVISAINKLEAELRSKEKSLSVHYLSPSI